jgi:hypothetical protein
MTRTSPALFNRWLDRSLEALDAGTRSLTPAQLAFQPYGSWSTAEVLEHLSVSYTSTVQKLRQAATGDLPPIRQVTLKDRMGALVAIDLGVIPRDQQAPDSTRPKGLESQEALHQARAALAALDELLIACVQRHGERARIAEHSALGPLTARQWARFHWVHTRNHLKQIARLRELQTA